MAWNASKYNNTNQARVSQLAFRNVLTIEDPYRFAKSRQVGCFPALRPDRTHSLKALSKCIETVHKGQIWASNEDLEHLINALTHIEPVQFNRSDGTPLLTRREEDVVRLVADGMKNREIAERLKVSEHSIRNYLYRIFDKLGVSSRVELILYAFNQRDQIN
jgi:DNA-binding NarL/FixJ family response regulator